MLIAYDGYVSCKERIDLVINKERSYERFLRWILCEMQKREKEKGNCVDELIEAKNVTVKRYTRHTQPLMSVEVCSTVYSCTFNNTALSE